MCFLFQLAILPLFLKIADRTTAAEQTGSNFVRDHHSRLMSTLSNVRRIQNNIDSNICNIANYDRERSKRGSFVKQAAVQGYKAVKFLLKGAKPLPKSELERLRNIDEFQNTGGFMRAYADFRVVVKPSSIKEYGPKGDRGIFGRVGDRLLMLHEKGSAGVPHMAIVKARSGPDIYRAKIIYYTDA